jgi:hypothetical protein
VENESSKSRVEQILSAISIANLIAGFKTYTEALRDIFRHRSRFVTRCLIPYPRDKLGTSIVVYLYGVLLSFILFLPFARFHGTAVSKVYFLFQFVYWQFLVTALVHFSAKAVRGRANWRDTATVACYFYGVFLPIGMLFLSPILLYVPISSFIYMDAAAAQAMAPKIEHHLVWVVSWLMVNIVVMFGLLFIGLRWVASAHQRKLRWLLLGLLLVYLPLMMLHNRFLAPHISRGIEVFSDYINSLF